MVLQAAVVALVLLDVALCSRGGEVEDGWARVRFRYASARECTAAHLAILTQRVAEDCKPFSLQILELDLERLELEYSCMGSDFDACAACAQAAAVAVGPGADGSMQRCNINHRLLGPLRNYRPPFVPWLRVQASELNGTVPDEKYWVVNRLTVEDCHEEGELLCEDPTIPCHWRWQGALVRFITAGVNCSVIFSKHNANNARGVATKALEDSDFAQIAQNEGELFLGLECSAPLALKRVKVKYLCEGAPRYNLQRYVPKLLRLQVKQSGEASQETLTSAEGGCHGDNSMSDHTLFETACD